MSESTPEPRPGSEPQPTNQAPDANASASGPLSSPPSTSPSGTRPQTPRPTAPVGDSTPADNADGTTSVESAKRAVGSAAKKLRGFSSGLTARAAKFASGRQKAGTEATSDSSHTTQPAASATPVNNTDSAATHTSASTTPEPTSPAIVAPDADAPIPSVTTRTGESASDAPSQQATNNTVTDHTNPLHGTREIASRKLGRLVSDEPQIDQPDAIKPPNSPTTAQITRTQQRPVVHANSDHTTDSNGNPSERAANSNVQRLPAPGEGPAAPVGRAKTAPGITTVPKPDRTNTAEAAAAHDGAGNNPHHDKTPAADGSDTPAGNANQTTAAKSAKPSKTIISTLLGYKLIHGGLALATTLLVFIALLGAGNLAATKHTAAAFGAVALVLFARFALRWWVDPVIAKRANAAQPLGAVCVTAAVAALASVAVITTRNVIATLVAGAITGILTAGLDFGGRKFATVVSDQPQRSSLQRTARLWSSGGIAAAAALLFITGVATASAGLQAAQLTLAIVAFVAAFASCVIALYLRSTKPTPTTTEPAQTKTYGLAALKHATASVPTPVSRGLMLTGVLGVAVPALIAPLVVPTYGAAGLATIIISVIVGLLVGSWLAGLRRVHNYIQPVSFLGLIGSAISCFLVELFVMQAVWAVFCGLWIGFLTVAGVGELGRSDKTDSDTTDSNTAGLTDTRQVHETFEQARSIPPRVAEGTAPLLAAVAALAGLAGLSAPWAAAAVAGVVGIAAIALCVVPNLRNRGNSTASASSQLTNDQGRTLRPSEVARAAAAQSTLTARPRPEAADQPAPATALPAAGIPSIVVADEEEYTTADRRLDRPNFDNPTPAQANATGLAAADQTPAAATPAETPEGTQRTLGWFIAIEGGDGAGKSTVVAALATAIQERSNAETIITREPGGTAQGTALRELLLHQNDWSARAEALLFAADRAQHVHQIIRPALDRDAIVITDRYVDSSIAYQGAGRDLGHDEILALSSWGTMNLSPDLTILLDVDPAVAAKRREADPRRSAPDRMERENLSFHNRVRTLFLERAEAEPDRYLVVDASVGRDAVVEQVLSKALPLLGLPVDPVYNRSALAGSSLTAGTETTETAGTETTETAGTDTTAGAHSVDSPASISSRDIDTSSNIVETHTGREQVGPEQTGLDTPTTGGSSSAEPDATSDSTTLDSQTTGGAETGNPLDYNTRSGVAADVTEVTEATEILGHSDTSSHNEALSRSEMQNRQDTPASATPTQTPAASPTETEFPSRRDLRDQSHTDNSATSNNPTTPASPAPEPTSNPLDRSSRLAPTDAPGTTAPLDQHNTHFPWENSGGTPSEGQPVDNLDWRRTPADEPAQTWSSLDDVFGAPTKDTTVDFDSHDEYGTEGGDTRRLPSAEDIVDLRNQTEDSRSRRRKFAAAERARREAEARKQRGEHDI